MSRHANRRARSKRKQRTRRSEPRVQLGVEVLEMRALLASVPVAVADTGFYTPLNTALVLSGGANLLANDSDVDGTSLTAAIVNSPAHGTITGTVSDGSLTYTPDTSF